jgi:hypothetical protein
MSPVLTEEKGVLPFCNCLWIFVIPALAAPVTRERELVIWLADMT